MASSGGVGIVNRGEGWWKLTVRNGHIRGRLMSIVEVQVAEQWPPKECPPEKVADLKDDDTIALSDEHGHHIRFLVKDQPTLELHVKDILDSLGLMNATAHQVPS